MAQTKLEVKVLPDSFNPLFFDALATHFVQSWEWGDIRKKTNTKVVRLGFFEGQTLQNIAQITFHQLPKVGKSIGHLAKCGPLSKVGLNELIQIGKENDAILIRIEPNLVNGEWTPTHPKLRQSSQNIFIPHNFLIDLTKPEEELLAAMHQKTRYNIKVAQKHNVQITETKDDEALEAFIKLQHETSARQKFYLHPDNYYRTVFHELAPKNMATLLVAKTPEGEILTVWFLVIFKDTLTYLYGASTQAHKEMMANNLVAWEAIKLGKKLGLTVFDFGGTMGKDANPKDNRYGFHKFKEGFGGQHVDYVGTFDLVVDPLIYPFYRTAEWLRWRWLRLKR